MLHKSRARGFRRGSDVRRKVRVASRRAQSNPVSSFVAGVRAVVRRLLPRRTVRQFPERAPADVTATGGSLPG
jgi:hypothetical protein